MRFFNVRAAWACIAFVIAPTGVLAAPPVGVFHSVIDLDAGAFGGNSPESVVFYNFAIQSAPLFSVFTGYENNIEDPEAIAVDPVTGDVYVAALDSGSPGALATGLDGVADTQGDLDLYRIDFQQVYNDWVTNQGSAYTSYYSQQPGLIHPNHTNPKFLSGAIKKIGEVGRTQGALAVYNRSIEFVDPNTLLLLDNDLGADTAVADHQIRALKRISASPGGAVYNVATDEGGFNNGTAERWESTILGKLNLDGASASEPKSIAYIDRDGIQGVWTGDEDFHSVGANDTQSDGDEIAFFQITNFSGTAGNGYREINEGSGPAYPTNFQLPDNPVVSPNTDNGNHDKIFVNHITGQLVVAESGYRDASPDGGAGWDQSSVITRQVDSYNDITNTPGGQITFGDWGYAQANPTGNDDSAFPLEGVYSIYDEVGNDVYYWDWDGAGGLVDVWKLDLDSGNTTLITQNIDNLFLPASFQRDNIAIFNAVPEPTSLMLFVLAAPALILVAVRGRKSNS